MEKYSSYKDSGVQWLGEIPSHWEVVPLKYCININNGRDYKEYESSEGIPVIGTGGQFAYSSVEMYRGEVVFFGRKGTVDKPFYYNGSFWAVDTVFFAIPKNNMLCKYLYYVGTTIPFGLYSTSTAIPSMTQTDLMNNPFALPPLSEQQTIASYLDSVTTQIDVAISQQQKMIDLLNERKQIIINNAVTKGLDPNVKMKDSGVDWIGEIPEGWEVVPMKRYCEINTGKTPSTTIPYYFENGDINWFTPGDLNEFELISSDRKVTNRARVDQACSIYPPKSVYMVGIGGTIGKVGFSEKEASCNQQINVIIPDEKILSHKYVAYFLQSSKIQIMRMANLSTLPIINQDRTGSLLIVVPSLEEQKNIIKYIVEQSTPINAAIQSANKQITLLQERKQIIINEVVTGKVKVS